MGAAGAANIVFRKDIKEAEDPAAMRAQKIQEYSDRFATPYVAAERGFVDMVIKPSDTREQIMEALEVLQNKKREGRVRGNMPL
jgi:acetyl-CoA carboxylase carboxyltransferase component